MELHPGSSTSSAMSGSVFGAHKAKFLIALSLVLTWTLAGLFHSNIKDAAMQKYDSIKHPAGLNRRPTFAQESAASKVALIIEPSPVHHLLPHLVFMLNVVPLDWKFVFVGSEKSVFSAGRSFATQKHIATGKLELLVLPKPWAIETKEDQDRLLTDMRFYDEFLPNAEWVFKYNSQSIMCASSDESLNSMLDFDWIGPRGRNGKGGGLTMRRVSSVRAILDSHVRANNTESEDEWFGERMARLPKAKIASATQRDHFSVQDVYANKPLGFHVGDGVNLAESVWKNPKQRKANLKYCPEVSIILPMKLERERCEGDNSIGEIIIPKVGELKANDTKAVNETKAAQGENAGHARLKI